MPEKPIMTTMGKNDRLVIPKTIVEELDLKETTNLAVMSREDTIIIKIVWTPDINKD